jgi:hypothetical protein
MPLDVMPGFYMGSDGYVWARETIAKNPEIAAQSLEHITVEMPS